MSSFKRQMQRFPISPPMTKQQQKPPRAISELLLDELWGEDPETELVPPRICTSQGCKNIIPSTVVYKTCPMCRLKDTEKQRRKKERQREKQRHGEKPEGTVKARDVKHAIVPWDEWPDVHIREKVAAYLKARRKAKGKACAIGKRRIVTQTSLSTVPHGVGATWIEYQTGACLHGALSDAVKDYYQRCRVQLQVGQPSRSSEPRLISFCGYYSIVADPKVSHRIRLDVESVLLHQIVKLPHSDHESWRVITETSTTLKFECHCVEGRPVPAPKPHVPSLLVLSLGPPPLPAVYSSSKVPLKRKQSVLSKWILKQGSKCSTTPKHSFPAQADAAPQRPPPGCGGVVSITVRDDPTHVLGSACQGQQICISVEHPR